MRSTPVSLPDAAQQGPLCRAALPCLEPGLCARAALGPRRSYAKGASETDLNIVLWQWVGKDCALEVVDDEGRLSRM